MATVTISDGIRYNSLMIYLKKYYHWMGNNVVLVYAKMKNKMLLK